MRAAFKYWKSRKLPPDFAKVLDLHSFSTNSSLYNTDQVTIFGNMEHDLDINFNGLGLIPPEEWNVYTIKNNKGLIYIKNPFTVAGQRHWIVRCLKDFSKKPYKLNIDAHGYLNENEDWWTTSHNKKYEKSHDLLKSLRWSTLGYHHDWDTKVYNEDNHNNFPGDLSEMCIAIASVFGFKNYIPQASIVNYYHMDSTLSPHTDHSEKNLDAPLISISFGQSAIFLIGGELEDIEPTALYLNSGDIIIMSKESRLCYHAVPRIVSAEKLPYEICPDEIQKEDLQFFNNIMDEQFWEPFSNYLNYSRININVRQVLHSHQKSLDDR